jgi:hypothetical protein
MTCHEVQLLTPSLYLPLPAEIGFYSASETAKGVSCSACPDGHTTAANTSTSVSACSGEVQEPKHAFCGGGMLPVVPTC